VAVLTIFAPCLAPDPGDLARPLDLYEMTVEEGGVLSIQRSNAEGRFEVWLRSYAQGGVEKSLITGNNAISGSRSLRISCEVKVIGGDHTLKFVLKNEKTNKWLANAQRRITSDTWTPVDVYLRVPPSEECRLRIDDQDVSHAPSSVQLRNIEVAEKAA
jgi:hypothetical protein